MKIQSEHLVDAEWLLKNIEDPNLILIEANATLPNYFEKSAEKEIKAVSGEEIYSKDHLPGADFIDLLTELTGDIDSNHFLPLPSDEKFSEVMSKHGICEGKKVVIYDRSIGVWACRFWLLLRHYGFHNAAILDGGWTKWKLDGYPLTSDRPSRLFSEKFFVDKKTPVFVEKHDVIEAMNSPSSCLINALTSNEFSGHDIVRYGRPGHIPGSKNVPSRTLVDIETCEFLDVEIIEEIFKGAGAFDSKETISYCGGAVGACSGVFLMIVIGIKNVALYNGSLKEWAAEKALPMSVLKENISE